MILEFLLLRQFFTKNVGQLIFYILFVIQYLDPDPDTYVPVSGPDLINIDLIAV